MRKLIQYQWRHLVVGMGLAMSMGYAAASLAASVTPEDMRLIQAASCSELLREYKNYSAAERAAAEEVRQSTNGTVATNVVGAASLATFGLGFFTWDNNLDADENLAELRAYRIAIGRVAEEKSCR